MHSVGNTSPGCCFIFLPLKPKEDRSLFQFSVSASVLPKVLSAGRDSSVSCSTLNPTYRVCGGNVGLKPNLRQAPAPSPAHLPVTPPRLRGAAQDKGCLKQTSE